MSNNEYVSACEEADRRNAESLTSETIKILQNPDMLLDLVHQHVIDNPMYVASDLVNLAMNKDSRESNCDSLKLMIEHLARKAARDEVRTLDADNILDERRRDYGDVVDDAYEASKP